MVPGGIVRLSLSGTWSLQRLPIEPCVRFSRTRLSDIVHRQACAAHGPNGPGEPVNAEGLQPSVVEPAAPVEASDPVLDAGQPGQALVDVTVDSLELPAELPCRK